jgi:transposase
MIERVVAEHAAAQPGDGLDGLRRIGIDEVAYRKGHRYLICIADHDTGGAARSSSSSRSPKTSRLTAAGTQTRGCWSAPASAAR